MFLRNRKSKGIWIQHPLGNLVKALKSEELEPLVEKLRTGISTDQDREVIFKAHIGFAISIASKYAAKHPGFADDFVSEALVAIARSIILAQTTLKDNNITPYIITNIHGKVSAYVQNNRTVGLKDAGLRKRLREGRDLASPLISSIDELEMDEAEGYEYRLFDPVDPRDYNLMEVEELIDKSVATPLQKTIIDLRKQGYNDQQIADQLHTSKVTVGIQKNLVKRRFYSYYREG